MLGLPEVFLKFIEQYGYWIVFFASFIEGESIIVSASIFASQGRLDIKKVVLITFIGTLLADQLLYFVGRYWGKSIFLRFPNFAKKSEKAIKFLRKYNTIFILSFRFIYGIRTISPVVIGISGISVKRFMILNFIAAAIWTFMCCGAGYWLGESILSQIKMGGVFKIIVIITLTLLILFILHRMIAMYLKNE